MSNHKCLKPDEPAAQGDHQDSRARDTEQEDGGPNGTLATSEANPCVANAALRCDCSCSMPCCCTQHTTLASLHSSTHRNSASVLGIMQLPGQSIIMCCMCYFRAMVIEMTWNN